MKTIEDKTRNKENFRKYMDEQGEMISEGQIFCIRRDLTETSIKKLLKKLIKENLEELTFVEASKIEENIREKRKIKNKEEEEAF